MALPEEPNVPLSDEAKQSIRLRRFLLAGLTYAIAGGMLLVLYTINFMSAAPVAVAVAVMIVVNLALFATFRSGLNLRFAEPSLTRLQMFIALALQMYIIYNMENGRGLALVFTFIVFLFGVHRLNRKEFVNLTLCTLAAYALVVNLLMRLRPEAIESVYLEWFSWLLLAMVLPGFGAMGGKFSELRDRLRASHLELTAAFETIQKMAMRDALSGLHNRVALIESLQRALSQGERYGRRVAVFFMDLDRFKAINDTFGHAVGDRVLREVADRIKHSVRSSDIVARLGGDEFVVLVEDFKSMSDLEILARKIVDALGQPLQLEGRALPMSVSVGIAVSPQDGRDVGTLLRHGDAAMYHAKRQGRCGYAIFSPQLTGSSPGAVAS